MKSLLKVLQYGGNKFDFSDIAYFNQHVLENQWNINKCLRARQRHVHLSKQTLQFGANSYFRSQHIDECLTARQGTFI